MIMKTNEVNDRIEKRLLGICKNEIMQLLSESDLNPEGKIRLVFDNVIVPLFDSYYDRDEKRIKTELVKNTSTPLLVIKDRASRLKTPDFKVVFDDGTIISTEGGRSGSDVLREFVEKVGVNDIKGLSIDGGGGDPFITSEITNILDSSPKPLGNNGGNYIKTKMGNRDKKDYIQRIIDKLELKAKIETIG